MRWHTDAALGAPPRGAGACGQDASTAPRFNRIRSENRGELLMPLRPSTLRRESRLVGMVAPLPRLTARRCSFQYGVPES
jgi:hypothetical protein